jgi:uncharacterized protein
MKKIALIISLFFSFGVFAQIEKVIPAKPNPSRLVNNYTNALTSAQVQLLEQKLVSYDDSTSNQIVIVVMETTGSYSIEEVALGILRTWGVGNKGKNNGIVILATIKERKVWIATGSGLEGAVPDITAKSIIDDDILPAFRTGDYFKGFDAGTTSLIKAAAGEYKAPASYADRGAKPGVGSLITIIVIIALFIIFGMFGRGKRGGGKYISRAGHGWFFPFFLGGMMGGGMGSGGRGMGGGTMGSGFGGFGGGGGMGGGAGGGW